VGCLFLLCRLTPTLSQRNPITLNATCSRSRFEALDITFPVIGSSRFRYRGPRQRPRRYIRSGAWGTRGANCQSTRHRRVCRAFCCVWSITSKDCRAASNGRSWLSGLAPGVYVTGAGSSAGRPARRSTLTGRYAAGQHARARCKGAAGKRCCGPRSRSGANGALSAPAPGRRQEGFAPGNQAALTSTCGQLIRKERPLLANIGRLGRL
jgi:hypothetical protein